MNKRKTMKNDRSMNAWAQGVQLRKENSCTPTFLPPPLLTALLLLFFSANMASAQQSEITWVDRDSFRIGYEVLSSADTLAANEQFSVMLHLDCTLDKEALGGSFDLDLHADISVDNSESHRLLSTCWLGEEADMTSGHTYSSAGHTASYLSHRVDSTLKTGIGGVLIANFTVGENPVATNEAIVALDGGLVVVDNLEMKRPHPAQDAPALAVQVYPNPCSDWLRVQASAEAGFQLRMYDGTGRMVKQENVDAGELLELRVNDLSKGQYFLRMTDSLGRTETKTVLISF